jgi:hypothetical protein
VGADEHQPQQIVLDMILEAGVEVRHERLSAEGARELGVLAFEAISAAEMVDGPSLRDGHEPGARIVRDA